MILKYIKAKNFYSFKELDLNLLQFKNIVYVKGINRDTGGSNGSGKSSILEMIVFGLFGKTIRKSTEEALINCDSRKALVVELDVCKLGVGEVKIIRGKRPNILNFYLDGQDLTQENALKTQEKIEHTLGLSYKTFIASIVFGQHSDLEFLSATTEDKRIIIRNFLNLEEIFTWRDKIKDLKSEYNTNAKVAETIILELKSQEDKLKLKMVDIEPVHMPETIEEVLIRETLINKSAQDINKLKDEHEDLKIEEDKLFAQIKLGEYSIKDTCKTCKKVYVKKQTKTNLRGLQRKLNSTVAKINKISNSLYKMRAELTKLKSKLSVTQWHELKKKEDLFLSQKKIRDEYNEIHARRQEQELKKNNLELNYEVMRFWEKAFSEQGLIKYFIRNILDYLNFKTNEYLSLLTNNQFVITFNEELEEIITNNGRKLSYISLSGGEKRKINLSVMLALQSLLGHTSKEQSNIIFFDEIAENMDEDGCVGVLNLLKSLKEEDKTIFLITHNAHLKSLLDGCQILKVEKKNGESRII